MNLVAVAALALAALSLLVALFGLTRGRGVGRRSAAAERDGAVFVGADSERLNGFEAQLGALARRLEAAEARGERSLHRVGVVRYNPFADTGSNQSFVLAMLDARGDGFVLSSLHSRQQTRVFLKAVTAGKGDSALSAEENQAIEAATRR